MKKLLIVLACIVAYGLLCSYGPHIDLPYGRPGLAIAAAMFALPATGFVWAGYLFYRWHRGFHQRMKGGLL